MDSYETILIVTACYEKLSLLFIRMLMQLLEDIGMEIYRKEKK